MSPRQILEDAVKDMLERGIVEECTSDYTSPMILIEVPGRDPRPCIDYRKLNLITKTTYYPLPNIDSNVETVAKANFITVLDLSKGYWQISMTKQAQRYAAFVTPFGTYQPKRMPFGLKNAPFTFCKLIRELTSGIHKFVETYFDDIAVFSSFWEDHLIHFKKVFETLKKAGLTVKPTKCQFAKATVKYF